MNSQNATIDAAHRAIDGKENFDNLVNQRYLDSFDRTQWISFDDAMAIIRDRSDSRMKHSGGK